MKSARRTEQRVHFERCELDSKPLPEARRVLPAIETDVKDLSIETGDELPLRILLLNVHSSQDQGMTPGNVLLNEFVRDVKAVPLFHVEQFLKTPAVIREAFVLENEAVLDSSVAVNRQIRVLIVHSSLSLLQFLP